MKNRPLLLAILTVITGAVFTGYLLLRPAGPDSDGSATISLSPPAAQQYRAFTAAAAGPGPALRPPAVPDKKDVLPARAPDAIATARMIFLRGAAREKYASARLGMLHRLNRILAARNEIAPAYQMFDDPGTAPTVLQASTAPPGTQRRLDNARQELENQLLDLTTLTPEARAEWDRHEAAAWRDLPPDQDSIDYIPIDDLISMERFLLSHDAVTTPLLLDYEQQEDRYAALMAGSPPRSDLLSIPGAPAAAKEFQRAAAALYKTLTQIELERQQWDGKWPEWEDSLEKPNPAPPDALLTE